MARDSDPVSEIGSMQLRKHPDSSFATCVRLDFEADKGVSLLG